MNSEGLVPSGIPQGLKPIDFIGFIGILRLRSGQARSRAVTKPSEVEFFRSVKPLVGVAISSLDPHFRLDGETGPQQVVWVFVLQIVKIDAHRDTLDYFYVVTGRVFRREER